MRKLLLFVFAVNLILLVFVSGQNYIYTSYLIPRLVWAVETLKLNFLAQREMYLACDKSKVHM